jgi:hypothetical protein
LAVGLPPGFLLQNPKQESGSIPLVSGVLNLNLKVL